jgi:sugar/nucleoside kinase (ribokinase family)
VLDLVTVGEAFDDYIFYNLTELPAPGRELKTGAFVRTIGGGAVITASTAARYGVRCGIVSALSREAAARLRRDGVAVRNLRRGQEPIALTVALSTPRDRRFVTYTGVNALLERRLRTVAPRLCARHLHFAFDPRPCRPWIAIAERLRAAGYRTSWDFGWNPDLIRDRAFPRLVDALDYLFVNRDEARAYRCRAASGVTVIKLGADGCRAIGQGVDLRVPAPRVRTIDTTGAGDVFNGAFLAAVLRGSPLRRALRVANRAAAESTRRVGGLA